LTVNNITKSEVTKPTPRKPSLKINAISNWIALVSTVVVGLMLTPYLIERLGTERYGIWALIISIIGYYGMLELGVNSAIMRYVARYAGQKDCNSLNKSVNTAIAILSLFGCVIILVAFLAAGALRSFFHIAPQNYNSFNVTVIMLSVTAGVALPGNVLRVVILAHEHFVICNIIRIVRALLKAILFYWVLHSGGGLVHLAVVFCVLNLLEICVNFVVIKWLFKYLIFSVMLVSWFTAKNLVSFGFFSFVAQVGNLMNTKLDSAIIGRFINVGAVGVYNIAAIIYGYLLYLIISLSGVFQPRLAALAGVVSKTDFNDIIIRYSVIVANFAAAVGAVALCTGEDFLKMWLPGNFQDVDAATKSLLILVVALMAGKMQDVAVNALRAVKKHKYYAIQTILEGFAHLTLSILLVRRFGIVGVAVGTAITAIIAKIIVQPLYFCRLFNIKWSHYMLKCIVRPLIVVSGIYLLFYNYVILFTVNSYPMLFLKGIVILFLYLSVSFFFCLDGRQRGEIIAKFKHILLDIQKLTKGKAVTE
jgi:O-antigen/teichoic acid export membrane protein